MGRGDQLLKEPAKSTRLGEGELSFQDTVVVWREDDVESVIMIC